MALNIYPVHHVMTGSEREDQEQSVEKSYRKQTLKARKKSNNADAFIVLQSEKYHSPAWNDEKLGVYEFFSDTQRWHGAPFKNERR